MAYVASGDRIPEETPQKTSDTREKEIEDGTETMKHQTRSAIVDDRTAQVHDGLVLVTTGESVSVSAAGLHRVNEEPMEASPTPKQGRH